MRTRFTPEGDSIVSGGKTFISSGDVANLILVFGKWAEIADDRRTISALILLVWTAPTASSVPE